MILHFIELKGGPKDQPGSKLLEGKIFKTLCGKEIRVIKTYQAYGPNTEICEQCNESRKKQYITLLCDGKIME